MLCNDCTRFIRITDWCCNGLCWTCYHQPRCEICSCRMMGGGFWVQEGSTILTVCGLCLRRRQPEVVNWSQEGF